MADDALGDRMKLYERTGSTAARFMPLLPIVVRLDGKAFHSFTRGLRRPYDPALSELMVATTKFLVELTGARIGYTQSDEITLILYSTEFASQVFFDGKRDKINSVLAAYCTNYFNRALPSLLPAKAGLPIESAPVFDCRSYNVPSVEEAVNTLLWRELDATRNSVSMAAQSEFSHKRLHGVTCDQMQELLFQERGINWNDYPSFFKRGTYVRRVTTTKPFTAAEIDALPPKHEARMNPSLVVERSTVSVLNMPPIGRVANRVAVVFDGVEPIQPVMSDPARVAPRG